MVTEVYGGSYLGPTIYHDDPAIGFSMIQYGDLKSIRISLLCPTRRNFSGGWISLFCKSRVIPFSGIDSVCRV